MSLSNQTHINPFGFWLLCSGQRASYTGVWRWWSAAFLLWCWWELTPECLFPNWKLSHLSSMNCRWFCEHSHRLLNIMPYICPMWTCVFNPFIQDLPFVYVDFLYSLHACSSGWGGKTQVRTMCKLAPIRVSVAACGFACCHIHCDLCHSDLLLHCTLCSLGCAETRGLL